MQVEMMTQTKNGPAKLINLPIPLRLWNAVGIRAIETGRKRYQVVAEALAAYLHVEAWPKDGKDGKKRA